MLREGEEFLDYLQSILPEGLEVIILADREYGNPHRLRYVEKQGWDYEYKRNGTRNLFVFVEPQAGYREVLATQHRRKSDFAYAMPYLVDVIYPEADMIDVVLDNLNTHHDHSLVEFFAKTEANRIMDRLSFHFTPPHGSWLNMAEIELSVLTRQSLKRCLPDEMTLATEILAWEAQLNAIAKPFNWSFTIEDARNVFKESYPSVSLN